MQHDFEDDTAEESGLTAVKLSLVGGFVGTLTGLKRRGLSGALLGGLAGGTAGYAAGSTLESGDTVEEWEDPLSDARDEPVTVDVSEDEGFEFDTDDEDEAGERAEGNAEADESEANEEDADEESDVEDGDEDEETEA